MSRPSLNFDWVAERYDATRGGERRGRQFAGNLAALLDKDRLAVEIGVGTGLVALALKDLGFRICGVDVSELMLERAKARLGTVVVRADAQHLPFAADSVDQALSVWVLHVVGDVSGALAGIARVLRPGGRYLTMDGHFFDKEDDDPIAAAWRDISSGLGIPPRRSRSEDWAQLAQSSGLRVVDMITSGPYEYEQSPAEVAHNIEARYNSLLRNVSDVDFDRVVMPVVARLRSMPDAERPIVQQDHQDILILER